jgi:hypothetical protein
MSNWNTITVADLNDFKVAELVTALQEEALGSGQADPTPGIIADVISIVRGAIGWSGRYELDANTAAIPKSLREIAAKKVIRTMKGRLQMALSDDEAKDAEVFEARLKALIKGEWPVEDADTPLAEPEVQSAAATPRITKRHRHFSRRDQDGI